MMYSVRWGWNSMLIYWISKILILSIWSDFCNSIAQPWKSESDSTRVSGQVMSSWAANLCLAYSYRVANTSIADR